MWIYALKWFTVLDHQFTICFGECFLVLVWYFTSLNLMQLYCCMSQDTQLVLHYISLRMLNCLCLWQVLLASVDLVQFSSVGLDMGQFITALVRCILSPLPDDQTIFWPTGWAVNKWWDTRSECGRPRLFLSSPAGVSVKLSLCFHFVCSLWLELHPIVSH